MWRRWRCTLWRYSVLRGCRCGGLCWKCEGGGRDRGQTGLPANFRQKAPEIHGSLVSPLTPSSPLTPEAVVRPPDVVPLVRRLEPSRLGQVLLAGRFVEGDAQARLVRHGDVALVDDGLFDDVHQVAPIG